MKKLAVKLENFAIPSQSACGAMDHPLWQQQILSWCKRLWVLKKSVFLKTTENWGIENV
jgi:hypothetical protein